MRTFATAIAWVAVSIGAVLLTFSFFTPQENRVAFAVALGLGIALMPGGLVAIITSYTSSVVIEASLRSRIDQVAASLASAVGRLNSTTEYLDRSHRLGVRMVYPERKQALHTFLSYAESYVLNDTLPRRELIFVGSSLKGVIQENPNFASQLETILRRAHEHECSCFFLLTHPFYSRHREAQEDRPVTGIAKDILHAIAWLEARRGDGNNMKIKVYKGTPTSFMISTTERMLINPYPYQVEAYKCFCLEVEANENLDALFTTYHTNHFYKPWYGEEKREDHYMQPIESIGWGHRGIRLGSRMAGVPVKGAFFRIA